MIDVKEEVKMDLRKFNDSLDELSNMLGDEGFLLETSKEFDYAVYFRIIEFREQMLIITSRLEGDVSEINALTQYAFDCVKRGKKVETNWIDKLLFSMSKLALDFSDFYIYTRMFLDALTVVIKLTFRCVGKKSADKIAHSVSCLLNEEKLKMYKEEIDSSFFDNLKRHLEWIKKLRESRDGLVHKFSHFGFSQTGETDLTYNIVGASKLEWNSDTSMGILTDIQNAVNNLTDLIEYLLASLPRKKYD
jgi:hypothetical protein